MPKEADVPESKVEEVPIVQVTVTDEGSNENEVEPDLPEEPQQPQLRYNYKAGEHVVCYGYYY